VVGPVLKSAPNTSWRRNRPYWTYTGSKNPSFVAMARIVASSAVRPT
jgi:hypothetical protein